jgi:hypothetical protein
LWIKRECPRRSARWHFLSFLPLVLAPYMMSNLNNCGITVSRPRS